MSHKNTIRPIIIRDIYTLTSDDDIAVEVLAVCEANDENSAVTGLCMAPVVDAPKPDPSSFHTKYNKTSTQEAQLSQCQTH